MPSSSALFRKWKRGDLLIETGTDTGAGIVAALAAGYRKVVSIEKANGAAEWWTSRVLVGVPEVVVLAGDSAFVLPTLFGGLYEWRTATIWLDAHSPQSVPLLEELDAVAAVREEFNGILLVDDMRLIRSRTEWAVGIDESQVLGRLRGFHIEYEASQYDPRDILVAWRQQ
jgi:hypothetical protein